MKMRKLSGCLCIVVATWLSWSCSVTKHIPEGSYYLEKNVVKEDKNAPKSERVKKSDYEKYIRLTPNKQFLGFMDIAPRLYLMADTAKEKKFINKILLRYGEPPVLLDTTQVEQSRANIEAFFQSKGYINAQATSHVDSAKKRATVTYSAIQNDPYRIAQIKYDFRDKVVESIVMQDNSGSQIEAGMVFDISKLDQERERISVLLRDRGYFKFTINNVDYTVDTTIGRNLVNMTLHVHQQTEGYDENSKPIQENNNIYRIRNINIFPDFDPTAAIIPGYRERHSSVTHNGLNFFYDKKLNIKERILDKNIGLYPNYLYNKSEVDRAYNSIMGLGYYRNAYILFSEVPDSVAGKHFVTFIGTENEELTTRERYLDCEIRCTPASRQSYSFDIEAAGSNADYYSIAATIGYQNRNLMRGAEIFNVSVRGGFDFIPKNNIQRLGSEIGATSSLSFARFISPIYINTANIYNPRTKIELSVHQQSREKKYKGRVISGASWGYSWSRSRQHHFTFKPADISVIHMKDVDSTFLAGLNNMYLANSYESKIIAGLSGSYVFNNQQNTLGNRLKHFRLNYETSGNFLHGVMLLFDEAQLARKNSNGEFLLFETPYSQYVRIEALFSQRIALGEKSSLAYRLWGGTGITYGNSKNSGMPFDRQFFSGGSNSMRGWTARSLGAGNELYNPNDNKNIYPHQTGDIKLEANIEARFPIWSALEGALFFDVGNIWHMKSAHSTDKDGNEVVDDSGKFKINTFYKQLGVNTGIGVRLNLGFLVVRVDWGVQLHNPNLPAGSRWINDFYRFRKNKNSSICLGLGYPF